LGWWRNPETPLSLVDDGAAPSDVQAPERLAELKRPCAVRQEVFIRGVMA